MQSLVSQKEKHGNPKQLLFRVAQRILLYGCVRPVSSVSSIESVESVDTMVIIKHLRHTMSSEGQPRPSQTSPKLVDAKELAQRSGQNYSTIQHWSSKGLLEFTRVGGKRRLYPLEENEKIVKFIRREQGRKGFTSLDSIKPKLEAGEHRK